jgi:hypothetical protein
MTIVTVDVGSVEIDLNDYTDAIYEYVQENYSKDQLLDLIEEMAAYEVFTADELLEAAGLENPAPKAVSEMAPYELAKEIVGCMSPYQFGGLVGYLIPAYKNAGNQNGNT